MATSETLLDKTPTRSNTPRQSPDKPENETNIPETTRLLKPRWIEVADRPSKTLRKILSKTKEIEDRNRAIVIHQNDCRNCEKQYAGQTEKTCDMNSRATKRHDRLPNLSRWRPRRIQIQLWKVKIAVYGRIKHAREFREAWHSSERPINRNRLMRLKDQPAKTIENGSWFSLQCIIHRR